MSTDKPFVNPLHFGAPTPVWEMQPEEIAALPEAFANAYTPDALQAWIAKYGAWAASLEPHQHASFIAGHEAGIRMLETQAAMHRMLLQAAELGVEPPPEMLTPHGLLPEQSS